MPIRVSIKGTPKMAKRAAARHGVPVRNCGVSGLPRGTLRKETICDAPDSARAKIMAWYAEKETRREGRGFAPGAMLYFNGARTKRRKRRR